MPVFNSPIAFGRGISHSCLLAEMEDVRKGIVDEKLAPELTPKQEKELTGKAV